VRPHAPRNRGRYGEPLPHPQGQEASACRGLAMFFGAPLRRGRWACSLGLHRTHQARMERHLLGLGAGGINTPLFSRRMEMESDAFGQLEVLKKWAKAPICGRGRWAYYQGFHRAHKARRKRHLLALGTGGKNKPFFTRRMRMKIDALGPLELLEKRAADADEKAKVASWWSAPFWRGCRDSLQVIAQRLRRRASQKASQGLEGGI